MMSSLTLLLIHYIAYIIFMEQIYLFFDDVEKIHDRKNFDLDITVIFFYHFIYID